MTGIILDGKSLAKQIESELAARVEKLIARSGGKVPVLGHHPGRRRSGLGDVRAHEGQCLQTGGDGVAPGGAALRKPTETVLAEIDKLNADPGVQGILLQHPVPEPVDERSCFERIARPRMWTG